MELYALTPKGYIVARSTNGEKNPQHPDYAKWKILYVLKFHHTADKNKLINLCGISPAACSLAIADLKRNGYIYDSSQTQPVGV
jgi:hypothetical protein